MFKLAISGKKNSGKDTLSKFISREIFKLKPAQYKITGFADKIKEVGEILFPGINKELLYGASKYREEPIKSDLNKIILDLNISVRQFAKDLGKLGRNYNPYFWVSYVALEYMMLSNDISFYCISDVRFVEEYEFLKKNGFILCRVKRDVQNSDNDVSETAQEQISDELFDIVIENNKSLEDFKSSIIVKFNDKLANNPAYLQLYHDKEKF